MLARRLADIGVGVTVLLTTDLYLMGLNPATPYGDCSLLRMANLHANVLQIAGAERLRECFAMLTERSARLLNLRDYGLAVRNPADIVIIDAPSPEQAVAEIRQPLAVYKHGRRTVIRYKPELVRPGDEQSVEQRISNSN